MADFISNSNFLPSPFFDSLSVDVDLIYFDRPICCVFKNAAAQLYAGHFLKEVNGTEYWCFVPTPRTQIRRLLTGRFPLMDLFSGAVDSFRIIGTIETRDDRLFQLTAISSNTAFEDVKEFLPDKGFLFFEDEFSDYLSEEFDDVRESAQANFAEIIDLRLTDKAISAMPLDNLSAIFSSTQRLVTNLACYKVDPDSFGKRGKTKLSIETRSKMALTTLKAGSVKLRFESIHQPDFLQTGFDPVHEGIKEFSELLGITNNDELCERLKTYPPRIRTNFMAFISAAQRTGTGVQSSWGSPVEETSKKTSWSAKDIKDIAEKVGMATVSDEVEFDVTGYFEKGSMGTSHFTLYEPSTGRRISGKVDSNEEEDPETLTLSKENSSSCVLYNVVIHETTKSKEDGSTSYSYKFTSISRNED